MRDPDIVYERVKARVEQYEIERRKKSNRRQIAIAVIAFAAIIGLSIFLYRKLGKGVTTKEPVSPTESVAIENSVTPTGSANLTETVIPTDIVKPTEGVTQTISPADDDPVPRIIWVDFPFLGITDDAKELIQQRLKEWGIDCSIEFISSEDRLGKDYKEWLDKMKNSKTVPDIISAGIWEHGVSDVVEFVKSELLPLNDFLATEEGQSLYSSYAEVEWDRTAVNGTYYTVPLRLANLDEVYLYVNDQYKDAFVDQFDGTYESMRNFCDMRSDSHPVIAMNFGKKLLEAFEGCYTGVFYGSYRVQTQEFLDLTKQDETKELLQTIYSDYQSGLAVYVDTPMVGTPVELPENTLVYIVSEKQDRLDGFTEIVWNRDLCKAAPGISYGVSVSSRHQELAKQILSLCYSDPELASLLCWKTADAERWEERTEYLATCASGSLAGFLPEISYEQFLALSQYNDDIQALCARMMTVRGGETVLNEQYPAYLNNFFNEKREYKDMAGVKAIDKLNEQLKKWLKSKE